MMHQLMSVAQPHSQCNSYKTSLTQATLFYHENRGRLREAEAEGGSLEIQQKAVQKNKIIKRLKTQQELKQHLLS